MEHLSNANRTAGALSLTTFLVEGLTCPAIGILPPFLHEGAGEYAQGLQPMEMIHAEAVRERPHPMGGTPCWSRTM